MASGAEIARLKSAVTFVADTGFAHQSGRQTLRKCDTPVHHAGLEDAVQQVEIMHCGLCGKASVDELVEVGGDRRIFADHAGMAAAEPAQRITKGDMHIKGQARTGGQGPCRGP